MAPDTAPRRLRWIGLAAGLLVGIADTATMVAFGVRFESGGHDVSRVVAAWFGTSFALLGFLLGDATEARRRERATAAALADTRERLARAEQLAALGELAAAIAHEVRNPLAVVRSAAQGIGETLDGGAPEARRAASFIIAEVDRLSTVTSTLLAASRPLPLEARPTPVDELIERAVRLAGEAMGAKQIRLHRQAAGALPQVRVDPDLLCQVLLGLLTNAVQSVPAGGEVSIAARAASDAVEVAVADTGPGVPAELRGRVFEAFFTTRPRGTGLGLAVARRIVEAHGGRIEVGERGGGGALFTVRLPVAAA